MQQSQRFNPYVRRSKWWPLWRLIIERETLPPPSANLNGRQVDHLHTASVLRTQKSVLLVQNCFLEYMWLIRPHFPFLQSVITIGLFLFCQDIVQPSSFDIQLCLDMYILHCGKNTIVGDAQTKMSFHVFKCYPLFSYQIFGSVSLFQGFDLTNLLNE